MGKLVFWLALIIAFSRPPLPQWKAVGEGTD
jgi:hypothetical protein